MKRERKAVNWFPRIHNKKLTKSCSCHNNGQGDQCAGIFSLGFQPVIEAISHKLPDWNGIIYAGFLTASSFAHPIICVTVTEVSSQIGLGIDAVFSSFQAISRLAMLATNLRYYLAYEKLTLAINGFNSLQALTEVSSLTTRMLELAAKHIGITIATATSLGLATLGLGVAGSSIYMLSSLIRICQATRHYQQVKRGQIEALNELSIQNDQAFQSQKQKAKRDIYHSAVSLGLSMFFVVGSITALLATVTPAGSAVLGVGISISILGTLGYLAYRIASHYYERNKANASSTYNQELKPIDQMAASHQPEIELETIKDSNPNCIPADNVDRAEQPDHTAAAIKSVTRDPSDDCDAEDRKQTDMVSETITNQTPDFGVEETMQHDTELEDGACSSACSFNELIEPEATSTTSTSDWPAANMYSFFNAKNNAASTLQASLQTILNETKHTSACELQRG